MQTHPTPDTTPNGDHDLPYRFGSRPTTEQPYPFSTRQYARLLSLRSRIEAGHFQDDQPA